MDLPALSLGFDPDTAVIAAFESSRRWPSQPAGCLGDELAYQNILAQGDQV